MKHLFGKDTPLWMTQGANWFSYLSVAHVLESAGISSEGCRICTCGDTGRVQVRLQGAAKISPH